MEWFGISCYGFPDPIKDMMRPDYKEPRVKPDVLEQYKKGLSNKPLAELVAEVDCYVGNIDGYAYGSSIRFNRLKKKGVVKPVGPNDMYKYAGTNQMKFGWWKNDPALKGETWFINTEHHSITTSEMSRYVNHALKADKYFKL